MTERNKKEAYAAAVPTEGGFFAEYGLPGQPIETIGGETPTLFASAIEAEVEALRKFVGRANEISRNKSKPAVSRRMSGAEFEAALVASGLSPREFAYLWGTTDDKVSAWIHGAMDVPFPIRWALPNLNLPGAMDAAMEIVEQNVNYKPEWFEYRRNARIFSSAMLTIEMALPEIERVAEVWETENPGKTHATRDAIRQYDEINNNEEGASLVERAKRIVEIAGILGLGEDINKIIIEQNAPYSKSIADQRRQRLVEERRIRAAMKPKWVDPYRVAN